MSNTKSSIIFFSKMLTKVNLCGYKNDPSAATLCSCIKCISWKDKLAECLQIYTSINWIYTHISNSNAYIAVAIPLKISYFLSIKPANHIAGFGVPPFLDTVAIAMDYRVMGTEGLWDWGSSCLSVQYHFGMISG